MKLPFELKDGEEVLQKETALDIRGNLSKSTGTLILTNQRLVFVAASNMWAASLGLIGMLFSKKKVKYDLPFGQIVGYWKGKYGLNKSKILKLDIGNEKVLTFAVTKKFDVWHEKLAPHIPHRTEKDEA